MNDKTREEIVAEREAKKKAKLIAKKKLNASTSTLTNNHQQPEPIIANLTAKVQPKHVPKSTKNEPTTGAVNKSKKHEQAIKSESTSEYQIEKVVSPKVATQNQKHSPAQKVQGSCDPITTAQPSIGGYNKSGKISSVEDKKVQNAEESSASEAGKVLSKAELKAARRMKQEMQRAAKSNKVEDQAQKPVQETLNKQQEKDKLLQKKVFVKTSNKSSAKNITKPKTSIHKVKLFNHLYYENELPSSIALINLHPAIIGLGVQYANRIIVGSNARCFSLMSALKFVIADYTTPQQKEFSRGLESILQQCLTFLQQCRPLAVSMTNATKHLKWQLTQLPNDVTDSEAKKRLQKVIDIYLDDQIELAGKAICISVQEKISDGDVILTYGCSSLIQRILIDTHNYGKKFRVVVVDSRPSREGLQLLRRLVRCGLQCSYVLVGAASCMMGEVTKVLLGAHALLANGYVMSRAGSSQVALLASAHNVPVLVCCETYKFCERVQTDAIVYNEIGDPDALVGCRDDNPMSGWRDIATLTPLNLTYDVTPPELVTAVVTELAILPCTSVPVILRIKPSDSHH